jgi:hypothetical protein
VTVLYEENSDFPSTAMAVCLIFGTQNVDWKFQLDWKALQELQVLQK